jgi:hypothetical protein
MEDMMGVYLEHSTFYHLPRTGGTWVRNVLFSGAVVGQVEPLIKHFRNRDAFLTRKHIPPTVVKPKNFSFAFVRHPLDWYQSIWKYRTRFGEWEAKNNCKLTEKCGRNDFREFIDAVIKNYPEGYYTKIVEEFAMVDFMGRQESLADDLIKALTMAGEKFDEEVIRNYKRAHVSRNIEVSYTPKQKEKLLKIERKVIDIYCR